MGKESQGCGRGRSRYGGRGKGRSNANPKKSDNKKPEMKFYPHAVGAQSQSVTFDTAKDYIVQNVQKTCDHGIDIAELLEKEEMKDLSVLVPRRKVSVASDASRQVEQDGFDIVHKVEVQEHLKRVQQLEENKTKACALIFSMYCNRVIQPCIKEHVDYESKIKNDPFELLEAI